MNSRLYIKLAKGCLMLPSLVTEFDEVCAHSTITTYIYMACKAHLSSSFQVILHTILGKTLRLQEQIIMEPLCNIRSYFYVRNGIYDESNQMSDHNPIIYVVLQLRHTNTFTVHVLGIPYQ